MSILIFNCVDTKALENLMKKKLNSNAISLKCFTQKPCGTKNLYNKNSMEVLLIRILLANIKNY